MHSLSTGSNLLRWLLQYSLTCLFLGLLPTMINTDWSVDYARDAFWTYYQSVAISYMLLGWIVPTFAKPIPSRMRVGGLVALVITYIGLGIAKAILGTGAAIIPVIMVNSYVSYAVLLIGPYLVLGSWRRAPAATDRRVP